MNRILLIHGPNLDLLGEREQSLYGTLSLAALNRRLEAEAERAGYALEVFQSNHEGELIDKLHSARRSADGVVINPGGLSHTSVSLRDAVACLSVPVVEVHISNVFSREAFRRRDL